MAKKSLLFISRLFSPHIGGVETHLNHLIDQLADKYNITVITSQHDKKLPLQQSTQNSQIYRLPFHQTGSLKISTWLWIIKHRQLFHQSDIIHIHDVFWWILPLWPLVYKKLYITFHGYEGTIPNKKQIFWHRLAAKMTRGNICIGGFHHQWYGVKPNIVSYGAASIKSKKLPTPKAKRKMKIVYLGRLESDMGLMAYLQGLQLFSQLADFTCDIYGDGPLRLKATRFVNKYHLPIIFHGFVANASQKISQADVAFAPGYLSIIEALQAGTPVVAIYNSQIKHDYLRLTPFAKWITIISNPQQLAAALPTISPLPAAATTWAKRQTWAKVANDYQNLWTK